MVATQAQWNGGQMKLKGLTQGRQRRWSNFYYKSMNKVDQDQMTYEAGHQREGSWCHY